MRFVYLLATAALIGAACGGDDDDDGAAEPDVTAAAESTTADGAAPEATTAEGTTAEGTTAEGTGAPARGDADLVIWSDETRGVVVQELADVFAEENGVTVEVQQIPLEDTLTQWTQSGPAGEGPDIVILPHDNLGTLVSNGLVEALDLGPVAEDFQQVAIDAATYDGQLYGVPYAIENIALFRNTDLVPEAPATFEEMAQIATDFKAQHASDPTYLGIGLQIGNSGDIYHYYPFLSVYGGYIFGENADGSYNPEDVGLDSPGGIAAATWLSEAAASGIINADVEYDTVLQSFGEGKAPFAVTGPWAISDPNSGIGASGVPFAVGPIPAVTARGPRPVRRGPDVLRVVVLEEHRSRQELRAGLCPAGVDADGAVRSRRASAGPDGPVRSGQVRSHRRRVRRCRCIRGTDSRHPGHGQRVGRRRLWPR